MSPYLFLFCAEGLSARLSEAEFCQKIHGSNYGTKKILVSHLFFADDSLLFFKADRKECETVMEILMKYEKVSGQRINFEKSEICFGRSIDSVRKNELQEVFGV